ncbi:DUF3231 family protein [Bacillaceae bacterium IKA-2]|nr:DUF3231 family protein [Bacillaceae bacterium IKA-2]
MGILDGNQKQEPMHYGEISGLWFFLQGENGAQAGYSTFLNHVGDVDLKKYIEDKLKNEMKPQMQQIENLLRENGIAVPPAPAEKPIANLESIPVGAKFSDLEIAATIAKNIGTGLTSLSLIMSICTREDIATMCGQFHMEKAQAGLRLLKLQKEKGWLVPPPLNVKTPEPVHA